LKSFEAPRHKQREIRSLFRFIFDTFVKSEIPRPQGGASRPGSWALGISSLTPQKTAGLMLAFPVKRIHSAYGGPMLKSPCPAD